MSERGVSKSVSPAGQCPEPDYVQQFVVEDSDDEPIGALEQWSSDAWMYAEIEDFRLVEPQNLIDFNNE